MDSRFGLVVQGEPKPDYEDPSNEFVGTEEDILAVNREEMKGFYDAWYRPEQMVLVAVGDFDDDGHQDLAGAWR